MWETGNCPEVPVSHSLIARIKISIIFIPIRIRSVGRTVSNFLHFPNKDLPIANSNWTVVNVCIVITIDGTIICEIWLLFLFLCLLLYTCSMQLKRSLRLKFRFTKLINFSWIRMERQMSQPSATNPLSFSGHWSYVIEIHENENEMTRKGNFLPMGQKDGDILSQW